MQQIDLSNVNWTNYVLLLCIAPAMALYCYRVLVPKYSFAKTLWCTLACSAVLSVMNVIASQTRGSGLTGPVLLCSLLEFACYCLLWLALSKSRFWRVLVFYIAFAILMGMGFAVGNFVDGLVVNAVGPNYLLDRALSGKASVLYTEIVQAMLIIVVSGFVAKRAKRLSVDVRWSMFALLLLTQMFSMLLLVGLLTWGTRSFFNVILLCVYMLLCAVADVYVLRTFRTMLGNAELTQEIALLDQQQALERAQYEAVEDQIRAVRRLRHDYVNTLSTIETLLSMEEPEKIREILHSTAEQLNSTRIVYTGNPVVDAVLYGKTVAAEEKGISVRCELLWPASPLNVTDTELMRIFGNLLDNAIHYCETLPAETPRVIEISSAMQGRMLVLRFSNAYREAAPPPIPQSDPSDAAHGHGLAIVRDIAEQNGGTLAERCADGVLTFTVLLGLRAEDTDPA